MGREEGEETQAKGNDNLFNRIITENFPNLKKVNHPAAGSLQNTKLSGPRKKHHQTHHNQSLQHTEQRKNSESYKKEKTSHI
jgi:hypothetical protein